MTEKRINASYTSRNEWKAEETKLIAQTFTKMIIYELKKFVQMRKTHCLCRGNNKLRNVGRHNTSLRSLLDGPWIFRFINVVEPVPVAARSKA